MLHEAGLILASFGSPIEIGTNPQSMIWGLPLAAAIVVVYKATKLPEIKAYNFIKEVVTLFSSILVFVIVTALILYAFAWLITE